MGKEFLERCNVTTLNITEHILAVCVRRSSGLRSKSFVIALSSKRLLNSKTVIVMALLIILTFRIGAFASVY